MRPLSPAAHSPAHLRRSRSATPLVGAGGANGFGGFNSAFSRRSPSQSARSSTGTGGIMRGGGTTGAAAGYSSFHDAPAGPTWSLPAHAASSPAILVHNELQHGRVSSSTSTTGGQNHNTASENHHPQLPATPRAFPVVRDAVSAQEKTFFAKRTRSSLERAEFLAREGANRKKEAAGDEQGSRFPSPFHFSADDGDEEVPDQHQDYRFDSENKDPSQEPPSCSLLQMKPKCTLFANQRFIHPAKARTKKRQAKTTRCIDDVLPVAKALFERIRAERVRQMHFLRKDQYIVLHFKIDRETRSPFFIFASVLPESEVIAHSCPLPTLLENPVVYHQSVTGRKDGGGRGDDGGSAIGGSTGTSYFEDDCGTGTKKTRLINKAGGVSSPPDTDRMIGGQKKAGLNSANSKRNKEPEQPGKNKPKSGLHVADQAQTAGGARSSGPVVSGSTSTPRGAADETTECSSSAARSRMISADSISLAAQIEQLKQRKQEFMTNPVDAFLQNNNPELALNADRSGNSAGRAGLCSAKFPSSSSSSAQRPRPASSGNRQKGTKTTTATVAGENQHNPHVKTEAAGSTVDQGAINGGGHHNYHHPEPRENKMANFLLGGVVHLSSGRRLHLRREDPIGASADAKVRKHEKRHYMTPKNKKGGQSENDVLSTTTGVTTTKGDGMNPRLPPSIGGFGKIIVHTASGRDSELFSSDERTSTRISSGGGGGGGNQKGIKKNPPSSASGAVTTASATSQYKVNSASARGPRATSTLQLTTSVVPPGRGAAPAVAASTRPSAKKPPRIPSPVFQSQTVPHSSAEAGRFEYPPPYLLGMETIKHPLVHFK
ncbi:unnamed protein product [Amoebophrya sp. A120]|nr:unnamed protein product [Amoebophrya sp. A120]|eukprot:GSA120T00000599001.1